ncbi:MAG: sugar phosphate isomerase/epimerase family protein [Methanoregulaceae archaeon]
MFFHEYDTREIFGFAREAGLTGLEFWIETPHFWLRGLPEQEVAAARSTNPSPMPLTIHAPILDLNPCSINPRVAEASVEYTVQAIGIAERLGASVLTVHPGRRTAKRPPGEADFERFRIYIGALRERAKASPVRIAIENMEPLVNSLLCTPDGVRELLDREPWLWFTLDVSHASGNESDEVFRYIELCRDRLANIHMSRANGGTMHFPIDGDAKSSRVLESLEEASYKGPITLEIEDRNFPRDLSSREKVAILEREVAFIRSALRA